ncbi:OmpA family protein [Flavobacterium sp. PLA-1-15]|uniref:OmpA family protein n=1 Tax=Flavobacterium sp. PLA-1-15 TaxID=3380533 RepID=UPI003B7DC5DC
MKRNYFTLLLLLCINFLSAQEKLELYFDFNKDIPNEKSTEKLINWLESIDSVEVSKIEGYCDFIDTDEYNKELSLRRANTVMSYLKGTGVNVKDIEIIGFGENFKQSEVQSENRKAIVYYQQIKRVETAKPLTESKLSKQITDSKVGEKYKLENLNFYNMSDVVVPESRPILVDLLRIMEANKTLKIEIQGHICCMPKDTYETAKLRAIAVYKYLIFNGIDKERLSYVSFGSSKPIYPLPEKSEAEKEANRRVEIMVISK